MIDGIVEAIEKSSKSNCREACEALLTRLINKFQDVFSP